MRPKVDVELIGHACLRIQCGDFLLVTDPWLTDTLAPLGIRMEPRPCISVEELASVTDGIFLSHIHPDHFCPTTLAAFPREIPVWIGRHENSMFRKEIEALGFDVTELPLGVTTEIFDGACAITIFPGEAVDSRAFDTALLVETHDFRLFENNDCSLPSCLYDAIARRGALSYAFLGFSPASFFPIAFEMDDARKADLLKEASERHYDSFVDAGVRLGANLSVPFANGFRFVSEVETWRNASFNDPYEAVSRLTRQGRRAMCLAPGDGLLRGEYVAAVRGPRNPSATTCDNVTTSSPGNTLSEALGRRIAEEWQRHGAHLTGLNGSRIAFRIQGDTTVSGWVDFDPADGTPVWNVGEASTYDMRYTYPAYALRLALERRIDWDVLNFASGVWVHQVRYVRDFHLLMRAAYLEPPNAGTRA